MKQFSLVDCSRGAPMGRSEYGADTIGSQPARAVRLFRVRLDSGGYDDGGAYWGAGQPLYCAKGEDYQRFVRAWSRYDAAVALSIPDSVLARPVGRA